MQKTWLFSVIALVVSLGMAMESIAQEATPQGKVSGEVGQELQKVEKDLLEKQDKKPKKEAGLPPAEAQKALKDAAAADKDEGKDSGREFEVKKIEWKGDVDLLEQFSLRGALERELTGRKLSLKEARKIAGTYEKQLVEQGYYLAKITFPDQDGKDGVLTGHIDQGRFGKITLYQRGVTPREPFRERFYTAEQVTQRLSLREGAPFQYNDLYNGVYSLNTHPDLVADAELKLKKKQEDGIQRREADVDLYVKDRVPVHGSLEFQNTGTEETDEWRAGLTLQHINLTKRDDILTLNIPVSLDLESIKSIASSYYLPHNWWRGGALSVYGGYSELAAEEVVGEATDIDGEGWFVGAMYQTHIIQNSHHAFDAGFSLTRRSVEDSIVFGGNEVIPNQVDLAPMSLLLTYSPMQPDALGGRTFVSSETIVHVGGFLGASDDEEFDLQRPDAPSDYVIEKIRLARVQPFQPEKGRGSWLAFGRIEGQLASDILIPSEQMAAGGLSTVRGYLEREVLGDDGVIGTLELRTPVLASALTERLFTREKSASGDFEKLQFVLFTDGAYMSQKETLPGDEDTETLLSVGAGLRLALGENFQSRFDWGFPLEETVESDSSGRGHVSVQFLF